MIKKLSKPRRVPTGLLRTGDVFTACYGDEQNVITVIVIDVSQAEQSFFINAYGSVTGNRLTLVTADKYIVVGGKYVEDKNQHR